MSNTDITSTEHWHTLRAAHVGSSDIACLLGVSKRKTRFTLWHEKRGTLPQLNIDDISHVRNGKYFEPAIASIGAESFGCQIRKVHRYIECDDCPALGVSMDYEEISTGMPPVEIKWSVFGNGWEWDGLTVTEAPDEYLIQVQAQLACNPRAPYARLWGFIHGEVRQMIVEPRPAIIEAVKAAASEFMQSVRDGVEPPVDFEMDGDALSRMAFNRPLVSVDWSADAEAADLVKAYLDASAEVKNVETQKESAKNALLKRLIDAAASAEKDDAKIVATTAAGKISIATVAANPGTVITEEMLGNVIGAKKGYRRMTVKELKETPNAP